MTLGLEMSECPLFALFIYLFIFLTLSIAHFVDSFMLCTHVVCFLITKSCSIYTYTLNDLYVL